MTEDFIQKLMIAKQVMDKSNNIPRGGVNDMPISNISESRRSSSPELQSYEPVSASYNIPQEYMEIKQPATTKAPVVTEDRIKNSKLPDAIKELMLKHPIKQPEQFSPTLSDEIVEKAARLMNENKQNTKTPPQTTSKLPTTQNNSELKKLIRETMEEILKENGIIAESESKTSETFQFRVGKHIFEGKLTKVKKIS
jgi:hypothetical protein